MSGNIINCISNCDKNTEENEQYDFKYVKWTIASDNNFLKQPNEFSTHDFKANIKDDNPNTLMNMLAALRNYKFSKPLKTGSKGNYKLANKLMLSCKHVSEEILKRSSEEVKTSLFNGEVLRNLNYIINFLHY
jgi:methionyl-tRNA synthetase